MIIEKAEEALKVLSKKMGGATTEFWPCFIRKQILDAVPVFFWLLVSAAWGIWLAPVCLTWPALEEIGPYSTDWMLILMRGLGVVIYMALLLCLMDAVDQIKYLGNLKYWALKDYMATLKNLIPGK